MPIDKFLTMLNEKSLYFPNITLFKDKYEGTLSRPSESLVLHSALVLIDFFNIDINPYYIRIHTQ